MTTTRDAATWHLVGLVAPMVILSGNLAGGTWILSGVVLVLLVYPILDVVSGTGRPAAVTHTSGALLARLPYLHVILQLCVFATLIWRVQLDGNAWTTWVAALSSGLNTGISAIVVAHELGHSRPLTFRWWLAKLNLLTAMYLHFTLEHNRQHHPAVATPRDPASAPRGQTFWRQLVRSVPAQFIDAWQLSDRCGRNGLRNTVLWGVALQCLVILLLWSALSGWVALAVIFHAGVAVFLLEYVNYIQHYGLSRGITESITPEHAWESQTRWSRWTLLELPLHPAHHLSPSLPFWQLDTIEGAPTLPTGYYGLFWPCLFSPLWKRWIDPRIPTTP